LRIPDAAWGGQFRRAITLSSGWVPAAGALCNVALFMGKSPWLYLLAGAVLYGYLPGFVLMRVVFGRQGAGREAERAVLSAACSFMLSTLVVLIVQLLPGPLSLTVVILALDATILALLAFNWARRAPIQSAEPPLSTRHVEIALLLAVLLLTLALRFVSLGYSEYQGDEIDVTHLSRLTIAGQDDALLLHRKGPVELIVAASFAIFTRSFNELGLRFPFALASVWAVLGAYVLGRRLLGPRVGVAAALLLALNGIFLGFSRMVQYQGVVALALVSAVLCYYRLSREAYPEQESRYGIMGLSLLGFGLLTHYEAGLIAVVLLLLYLDRHPLSGWRWSTLRPLLVAGGLIALALAAYYVPFALHPHFGDTFRRYTQIRIGLDRAPFNNLSDYLTSGLFYNSIYYEIGMMAGLLIAGWAALRRNSPRTPWPILVWALFAIGLVGSAVAPSWLQIGAFHLGIVLVMPALLLLALGRGNPVAVRLLFAWFGIYLIAYAFLIRTPGLHYYTLFPAWALLAAWGLVLAVRRLGPTPWGWGFVGLLVVVGALCVYHPYLLFLKTTPEYAITYPGSRSPLFWDTSDGPPDRFFGLPHRSGWKALSYLFAEGTLQGDYRTNEKADIAGWYMGRPPSEAQRPAYYLIAGNPTEKEHNQDYPKDLLASEYREVGAIAVGGEPRLHVYHFGDTGSPVGPRADQRLASLYDQITGLSLPAGEQP
jgi:hypothetical protein